MLYLATASGPSVCDAIARGDLGQMVTYKSANRLVPGATFAVDNGVVTMADRRPTTDPHWSPDRWQASLEAAMPHVDRCLFAAVPDVVADAAATDVQWRRWASAVSRRGLTPAYVAQDGCRRIPAGALAVFLGGSDAWKLGQGGRDAAAAAKASGRWLHMGRVNSWRRLRYAMSLGCDSVDGTLLAHGPDRWLRPLVSWLREVHDQGALLLD